MKAIILISIIGLCLVSFLPQAAVAQVIINPADPVPVPYNPQFGSCSLLGRILGVCGPAGEVTITGLILGRFSLMKELSYPKWAMGQSLEDMIKEKLSHRRQLPVIKIDYFGHPSHFFYNQGKLKEDSIAFPSGIKVGLSASNKIKLSWLEKLTA